MKKLISSLFLGLLLWSSAISADATQMLIPVGKVVGLQLHNDTVTVADFEEGSCALCAGMQVGDRLLRIDDHPIKTPEDVRHALNRSSGTVQITLQRGDSLTSIRVQPQITTDGPKLGVYLRRGITGIGTVTYYDPETKTFAALGHGVNDPHGQLASMTQGDVYEASIVSVRKGKAGSPGQLMGSVSTATPCGSLRSNTAQGVFGDIALPRLPQPLPVGACADVTAGPATILSTVTGDTPKEYSVEIVKTYAPSRQNGRNMLIRITDPALLEITGGIVQGMSGSPIIQNGKLVGAVTHVLVNDPTTGYGIFIENMLDAAA